MPTHNIIVSWKPELETVRIVALVVNGKAVRARGGRSPSPVTLSPGASRNGKFLVDSTIIVDSGGPVNIAIDIVSRADPSKYVHVADTQALKRDVPWHTDSKNVDAP